MLRSPGTYAVTTSPFVSRTRQQQRFAEFCGLAWTMYDERVRFVLLCALLVACGARSEIAGVLPVEDAGAHDAHDAGDAGCAVTLSVGTIVPTPSSCWIDQKVSNVTTTLSWDCKTGAAEADFDVPFEGTVDPNGNVSIQATTTFPWSDGCTWESAQVIAGQLSSKALTYSYSEHPIQGTSCAPDYCKSTATVSVQ